MLLAEMIDQREDNVNKEDAIGKALTYGIKLPEEGINAQTMLQI
jgi:hypothetical protein